MNQRGYSLIELMMVICVIGVLTMVAMTEYNKIHNRAYVGAALSDLQLFRQAISLYDAEWGTFPRDPAASAAALAAMLVDPGGNYYLDAPRDHNFDAFSYTPPDGGEDYGDYTLTVICRDHWRTQITAHSARDIEMLRLN